MQKLFGTDGIRGRAGTFPLDQQTMCRLGQALAILDHRMVLVATDTRFSGPDIARWIRSGLRSKGGDLIFGGVLPTAAVCYLCRERFDLGLVISASHNPAQDNGVKIFSSRGVKLSDPEQDHLEELLAKAPDFCPETELPEPDDSLGRLYEDFLESCVQTGWQRLRVVVDCANGAAYRIAPQVLTEMGLEVIAVNVDPDGYNINDGCGALHPESLSDLVRDQGADLGLAFDGDADRLITVDEEGTVRDGDYILFVLGRFLREHGRLETSTIVGTVMANMGLEVALARESIGLLRTDVGDRFVRAEMDRGGHQLGGEQSGHVILNDFLPTGDGLLTAISVIDVMQQTGKKYSQLCEGISKFPQRLVNVRVNRKPPFESIPEVAEAVSRAERDLANDGRLLLRYSGTENIARVMVEAKDAGQTDRVVSRIVDVVKRNLGVK